MTLVEVLILGGLGTWFAATVIYQFFTHRLLRLTGRWDIFRLLPSYWLFTGDPVDLRLFYRDGLVGGQLTDWQEIPLAGPLRWYHIIWQPGRLRTDVLSSLVDDLDTRLARQTLQAAGKDLTKSFVYEGLWRIVRRLPAKQAAIERQFKVEKWGGHTAPRVVETLYHSPFHRL